MIWTKTSRHRGRSETDRNPTCASPVLLRRLEPRRVLNATITSLSVPATALEGDTVEVSATGTGTAPLAFDWTVTHEGQVVERASQPTFQFTTAEEGTYDVTFRLLSRTTQVFEVETAQIAVGNAPPSLQDLSITDATEGSAVRLTGRIDDPGAGDTFTLTVDWGDGAVETFTRAADERDIDLSHTYADDDPTETLFDTVPVTVTVTDDGGDSDSQTLHPTIFNARPELANLHVTPSTEGGLARLTGRIVDPGVRDTFVVAVEWGDGVIEAFQFGADEREFNLTHTYLDDDPSGTGIDFPQLMVTVIDDDFGSSFQRITTSVANVRPELLNLEVTDATEGSATRLTGTIFDRGVFDTFTLTVDWGDGTVEQFAIDANERDFELSHVYADDDPSGTPFDLYDVQLTVTDDDIGHNSATLSARVDNATPDVVDLRVTDSVEGGLARLTGRIDDAGVRDTFTLTVDWGDGVIETLSLSADERDLDLTHSYVDDDPSGTPADTPTVTVTLTDDDTGSRTRTFLPTVANEAPVIAAIDPYTINEGDRVALTVNGTPRVTFTDAGVRDTHTATIDWGDGSPVESLAVSFSAGSGRLDGSHTYADDGLYTALVTVTDDDGGVTTAEFTVSVDNIDPQLTGTDDLMVDEGQGFTLAGLGVGVTDPGFDNPDNGSGTEEFFLEGTIDWGDGSQATAVRFVDRTSGSEGVPTVATPEHDTHHYADNGDYTVTITFGDDDGPTVDRSFTITVKNVAPSLTLVDPMAVLDEGDTLSISLLGVFTDPGFNNPDRPGGASFESFSYEIDWGDQSDDAIETGNVPAADVVTGSPGVETTGELTGAFSHTYADNDADNRYTITVTLTDDDGGSVTRSVVITVNNVDPTLDPLAATDLGGDGVTTLDLSFLDPGADEFEVLVDWGDKPELDPDARFVVERVHAGETPKSFTILHRYTGPPNPQNPTADIIIRVKVRDDDFGVSGVVTPGESNVETVAISNSGIEENKVAIDTTPQAPPLTFPPRPDTVRVPERTTDTNIEQSSGDEGAAAAELTIGAERYLELRMVAPDGLEGEGVRLKDAALDDLPALFAVLPEGRYRVYVVYTETNSRRLALDFHVRGGVVIDPSDDTDGGRDRPPTEEAVTPPVEDASPLDQRLPPAPVTPDQADLEEHTAPAAPLAAAALATAATRTDWARRVEAALTRASEDRWRRLFQRKRR